MDIDDPKFNNSAPGYERQLPYRIPDPIQTSYGASFETQTAVEAQRIVTDTIAGTAIQGASDAEII